jgi:hypothetical protein
MAKIEFLGGPLNGELLEVPDGNYSAYAELKNKWSDNPELIRHLYKKTPFIYDNKGFCKMVYQGIADENKE